MVITVIANKSPAKSPAKSPVKVTTDSKFTAKSPIIKITSDSKLPVKSPRKSPAKSSTSEGNEQADKENGEFGICNARSKLQRLGKLYSGK